MDARAVELIASLGMIPHPEGGRYCEVYRSSSSVQPLDGRPERAGLTTIYFLLTRGEVSRWHRVRSDEAWHYCEGAALELYTAAADFSRLGRALLGRCDEGVRPAAVVPAGVWQAARSTGAYTLAGCAVAPGFEFADFQMLRNSAPDVEAVKRFQPATVIFI